MPEYICSCCGSTIESETEVQGKITCGRCGGILTVESLQKVMPPGMRVGGYEIIRHIATGGTGSVYLAEQISMERQVALKILNADQVSSGNAERFLTEARNTAKFENPHVVSVIDTGISEEGYYYIAMQYVEGESLEDILQRGRVFSEEETLITGITVAEALRMIWNKNKMFHKDIKPGNIMLTRENEAMVLDMGTAQERGESRLTDGNIEGSPYYMSPEQARGESLSWSTDQYSLGATMYQMVTGKYLYDGPDVETILRQHDSAPFPDPAVRVPDLEISKRMTEILRKMLEKKPGQRYSSWEEFIRDAKKLLGQILDRRGSSVSGNLQRKYMEINRMDGTAGSKSQAAAPSPGRFICYGLLIFILSAALLGGIFLYLAIRKNSANAEKLLDPIRKQVNSLQMDPDAADEMIRKSEPYFNRLGVLPSLRRELEKSRQKVKEFRELSRNEDSLITRLESQAAEQLQAADREMEKVKDARHPGQAERHFKRSIGILRGMTGQVKKHTFVLLPNLSRAEELQKRLRTAQQTVQRERIQYLRAHNQPGRRPAGPSLNKKKPAPAAGKPGSPEKKVVKQSGTKVAASMRKIPAENLDAQEKNRLRVLLLEQHRKGELNTLPALRLKQDDLPPERRAEFSRWLTGMRHTTESALKIRRMFYDSHQTFSGFHFTVMTNSGYARMELKTILRDDAVLYKPGMPNIRVRLMQLPNAEWLDFLRMAAKRKNLEKELDSYLLLDGWFSQVAKSGDAFVRMEVPAMREVYFRYLTGEKIEGIDPLKESVEKEIARKYVSDPYFAPFLAKLEQRKRTGVKKVSPERREK